jgi:hypothetical protein
MVAIRLLRAVGVGMVTATLALGVYAADETRAPVAEYITLPKFCWYEFSGGQVVGSGPEWQWSNCGPHMNHYCYGLLDLQRSKKAKNVGDRGMLLGRAKIHTAYTLNGMKVDGTLGTCSIAPHVQATMREIELQMRIYNIK